MNLAERVLAVQKGERGIPRDPNAPKVAQPPARAFDPGSMPPPPDNAPPAPWLPVPEAVNQPAAAPTVTWAPPVIPGKEDQHRLVSRAPAPPVVV